MDDSKVQATMLLNYCSILLSSLLLAIMAECSLCDKGFPNTIASSFPLVMWFHTERDVVSESVRGAATDDLSKL